MRQMKLPFPERVGVEVYLFSAVRILPGMESELPNYIFTING